MKIIVFGATGMVGQGVLREAMLDPEVEAVLAVVRAPTGKQHPKLRELVHTDFDSYAGIEGELAGYQACLFCLGVSSAGMTEHDYRRVTYDYAVVAATALAAQNPAMTFIYVSGAGTDGTAKGRSMWARVKGETENALLAMPFAATYMFRPAFIQPMHGITSKTKLYRVGYAVMGPLYPLLKALLPKYVTTTEQVGRAMLTVAKHGAPSSILENDEINRIASAGAPAS